jgi:hypothetical protein
MSARIKEISEILKFWAYILFQAEETLRHATYLDGVLLYIILGGLVLDVFWFKKGKDLKKEYFERGALYIALIIYGILVLRAPYILVRQAENKVKSPAPIGQEQAAKSIKKGKEIVIYGNDLLNKETGELHSQCVTMTPGMRKLRDDTLFFLGRFDYFKGTPIGQISKEVIDTQDVSGKGDLFKEKLAYIDKHVEAIQEANKYLESLMSKDGGEITERHITPQLAQRLNELISKYKLTPIVISFIYGNEEAHKFAIEIQLFIQDYGGRFIMDQFSYPRRKGIQFDPNEPKIIIGTCE